MITINDAHIESINIEETKEENPLSLDNPSMESLKKAYPDLKVYRDSGSEFHLLSRIVTEENKWMEHQECLEVKGLGVLWREFDLYDRHQSITSQFIYGAKLEHLESGAVRMVRDDQAIREIGKLLHEK